MKQHLAHQHEERNGRERKAGHRLHGVPRQLRQPLLAAEEQQSRDDVDGEEAERDRQAEAHQRHEAAEHDEACFDPVHGAHPTEVASMRRPGSL
jgi:hypothetical protein